MPAFESTSILKLVKASNSDRRITEKLILKTFLVVPKRSFLYKIFK